MKKYLLFLMLLLPLLIPLSANADSATLVSSSSSSYYQTGFITGTPSGNDAVWNTPAFTMTQKKNSGSDIVLTYNEIRVYAKHSLSFTCKPGYKITSVIAAATNNTYASALGGGSVTACLKSVSGSNVTITPDSDITGDNENLNTFTLVNSAKGFYKTIVVTYEATDNGGGDTAVDPTEAQFGWSASSAEVTIGDSNNSFPTLNNTLSLGVSYESTNTAVATIANNGDITLVGAGETTIKATSTATSAYNSVIRQYTLTVNAAQGGGEQGGGESGTNLNATLGSFSAVSGTIVPNIITYETATNEAANAPAINSNCVRLYQGSPGGSFIVKAAQGYKIKLVRITNSADNSTTAAHKVDDGTESTRSSVAKSASYTVDNITASKVEIFCYGTSKTTRLNVASVYVEYTADASLTQPRISAAPESLNLGKVMTPNVPAAQTLTVTGANLDAAITYAWQKGASSPFSATGTLTAEGGELSISLNSTAVATHEDNLILTSGSTSISVPVTAEIYDLNGSGLGTLESPYNVARALHLIELGLNNETEEVYVTGVVTNDAVSINSTYGSARYDIKDNGGTDNLYVYNGYYSVGNGQFDADHTVVEGDVVVICGKLKLYNNTTAEIDQNNYIVKKNNEFTAQYQISVEPTMSIYRTLSQKIEATVAPEGATLTYASSNQAIATVDAAGNVTGVSDGTANITVTATASGIIRGNTAIVAVTVSTPATVFTVETERSVYVGKSINLNASVSSEATLSYESSNPAVATVDAEGKVTGVAEGTATITISAPANGAFLAGSTTVTITVSEANFEELTDVLTAEDFQVGGSYGEYTFTSKNGVSYSVYCMLNTGYMQMNGGKAEGSGIVVTNLPDGYVLSSVKLTHGKTTYRAFDLYEKDSKYTEAKDLKSTKTQGTKVTGLTAAEVESYTFEDNKPTYVGLNLTGSNAAYISSFEFVWEAAKKAESNLAWTGLTDGKFVFTLGDAISTLPTLSYPSDLTVANISYTSDNEDVAKYENNAWTLAKGSATITAHFIGDSKYKAAEVSYLLKVIDPSILPCEKPTFSINESKHIVIACENAESIMYTVKIGNNTSEPEVYSAPVKLKNTSTITAWGIDGNDNEGESTYRTFKANLVEGEGWEIVTDYTELPEGEYVIATTPLAGSDYIDDADKDKRFAYLAATNSHVALTDMAADFSTFTLSTEDEENAIINIAKTETEGYYTLTAAANNNIISVEVAGTGIASEETTHKNYESEFEIFDDDASSDFGVVIRAKGQTSRQIICNNNGEFRHFASANVTQKNFYSRVSLYKKEMLASELEPMNPVYHVAATHFDHADDGSVSVRYELEHVDQADVVSYDIWVVEVENPAAPASSRRRVAAGDTDPNGHTIIGATSHALADGTSGSFDLDGLTADGDTHYVVLRAQANMVDGTAVAAKTSVAGHPVGSTGEKILAVDTSKAGETTGVEDVVATAADSEVVYYNLQGVRVENPANGIYIKRQGGKTVKVHIR